MPAQAAKVQIEGARELRASLKAVDAELPKELAGIHKAIAEPIAQAAAGRAPKPTGRLAASIRPQGTQRVARVAAGGRAVPYAGPIEFGWPARNIAPAGFLLGALEAEAEATGDRYLEAIDALIERVWHRGP
jgi:creatinine amidohydrolase/Fe(II)-dependent formamide hydrolase-like protein